MADHLLVLDHDLGEGPAAVVGTYRLIRREAAARVGGFYSASEYDVAKLTGRPGPVLELGRSCVDIQYRGRPTMQLLWAGIAAYIAKHNIEVMFGCASLPGTDLQTLAVPLTYLHSAHLAPPELRPRAVPGRYVDMARMDPALIDHRAALADYEATMRPFVDKGQSLPPGTPGLANPQSLAARRVLWTVLRAVASRPAQRLGALAGRFSPPADEFELPPMPAR